MEASPPPSEKTNKQKNSKPRTWTYVTKKSVAINGGYLQSIQEDCLAASEVHSFKVHTLLMQSMQTEKWHKIMIHRPKFHVLYPVCN